MGRGTEEKVVWVDATVGPGTPGRKGWPSSLQGRGQLREGFPEKHTSFWKRNLLQTLMELQGNPEQKTLEKRQDPISSHWKGEAGPREQREGRGGQGQGWSMGTMGAVAAMGQLSLQGPVRRQRQGPRDKSRQQVLQSVWGTGF